MKFWKKLYKSPITEQFLRRREDYCVSAISRFNTGIINNVWAAKPKQEAGSNTICALLLYGRQMLFPVFDFSESQSKEIIPKGLPLPFFFRTILKNNFLHAVQGLAPDMDILEKALQKIGFFPASRYDYELRSLEIADIHSSAENQAKINGFSAKTPPGLVIRRAEMADTDALYPLQAAYETEEVLPQGAQLNPAQCRLGLERLIAAQSVLAAQFDGRLVGKININAQAYTRFQIGGVYVNPEFRGLGIAQAMTTALIREFALQKNRFTLFVKKANNSAIRVYEKTGFKKIGDYRIAYY